LPDVIGHQQLAAGLHDSHCPTRSRPCVVAPSGFIHGRHIVSKTQTAEPLLPVEDLEYLVKADLELSARAEVIAKEKAKIRETLLAALATGTHEIADAKVIITEPYRWAAKGTKDFRHAYPADQWPELYSLELNNKAIEDELAPSEIRQFKSKSAKQIRVTEVKA
jgi:hypothetical protein